MAAVEVRKATSADEATVVDVLTDAFSTDPVTTWVIWSPPRPARKVRHLFEGAVRAALRRPDHEVYVTADGRGVALWHGVKRHKPTTGEFLRSSPSLLRGVGFGVARGIRLMGPMEKAHPKEPHYYLEFLGARPASQGRGIGSALLASMLERCDEEGVPAYLENSNPRNTPLYARHGFEVRRPIDVPKGCPPLIGMWREAR